RNIYINKNTWNIYRYEDDHWVDQGIIKGEKGNDGDDGRSIDVIDYIPDETCDPKNTYIDKNTWTIYNYIDDKWVNRGSIKGIDGIDGKNGKDGNIIDIVDQEPDDTFDPNNIYICKNT